MANRNRLLSKSISVNNNELGASIVEYALIVTFITLLGFASMQTVGTAMSSVFNPSGVGNDGGRLLNKSMGPNTLETLAGCAQDCNLPGKSGDDNQPTQ